MSFSPDKILTISARDYVEMQGKRLCDYDAQGVHAVEELSCLGQNYFMKLVPTNAEVVVDYRVAAAGKSYSGVYSASGTALIPKDDRRQVSNLENV